MNIFVALEVLRSLEHIEDGIVLGIIAVDGSVRLRVADPIMVQGHTDWLRKEPMADVFRGFSLYCVKGLVVRLYPDSALNPPPSHRIERDLNEALKVQLPMSPQFDEFN